MGVLLALGYMISYLFGIGVLLLPQVVQAVGTGYFIIFLTGIAVLLNLVAYVILELVEITGDDVERSVKSFLDRYGNIVPVLMGVFTYCALTAYVIAAGNQLSVLLGGDPHHWSTLFFILASVPAVKGLKYAARTSTYLSLLLMSVILFVIPTNTRFASFTPPFFGDIGSVPLLISLSAFALAGHFSIYEIHRLLRDEKKNIAVFFGAFSFAYLVYILFGITTSSVSAGIAELSTTTLAGIYPPFYALLVSAIAILAFYTSFVTVSHSFMKTFENYTSRNAIYALLLLPLAFLYILVREFSAVSLTGLVARVGGTSLLLFFALASFAHTKASERWKVKFPPAASMALSLVFVGLAFIGLFL